MKRDRDERAAGIHKMDLDEGKSSSVPPTTGEKGGRGVVHQEPLTRRTGRKESQRRNPWTVRARMTSSPKQVSTAPHLDDGNKIPPTEKGKKLTKSASKNSRRSLSMSRKGSRSVFLAKQDSPNARKQSMSLPKRSQSDTLPRSTKVASLKENVSSFGNVTRRNSTSWSKGRVSPAVSRDDTETKHVAESQHSTEATGSTEARESNVSVITVSASKKSKSASIGVGLERQMDGAYHVNRLVETSLFATTDLKIGDEVVSVNNVSCKGLTLWEIKELFADIDGSMTIVALQKPSAASDDGLFTQQGAAAGMTGHGSDPFATTEPRIVIDLRTKDLIQSPLMKQKEVASLIGDSDSEACTATLASFGDTYVHSNMYKPDWKEDLAEDLCLACLCVDRDVTEFKSALSIPDDNSTIWTLATGQALV